MDAIVLAAGKPKKDLAQIVSDGIATIHGKPILKIVIEQLSKCSSISAIIVVLNDTKISEVYDFPSNTIPALNENSASLMDSVNTGLANLKSSDGQVLILTSDLPFISSDAIEDFINRCEDSPQTSIFYPIIRKDDVIRSFKGTKRTYVRLKEGTFTGGNIFLVKPEVFLSNRARIEDTFNKRKSPLKLIGMLGILFLIKLLIGRLGINELERKCSQIMGANCRAVITPFAEIGVDVDKATDLEFARERLAVS
jgi:molybdopterin-guanine dinucleotide biosynthesis protein A